ncbi:hypothetical protein DBR06_SOUSAS10710052, partial [Sousa chinensis]
MEGEIFKCFEPKIFCFMSMSFLKASKEHSKQLYIDPKDRP